MYVLQKTQVYVDINPCRLVNTFERTVMTLPSGLGGAGPLVLLVPDGEAVLNVSNYRTVDKAEHSTTLESSATPLRQHYDFLHHLTLKMKLK